MKSQALFLTAAMALGAASAAQASGSGSSESSYFTTPDAANTRHLDVVDKGYASVLMSDNDGAVQSGLAHVAYIALYVPDGKLNQIKRQVEYLVVSGRTPAIRFKAYLASAVFDSPAIFARERQVIYKDGDEFFSAVSMELQRSLLGDNGNR